MGGNHHSGTDHAGSFTAAAHCNFFTVDHEGNCQFLGAGIRCHNGMCRPVTAFVGEQFDPGTDPGCDLIHGQLHSDPAGGSQKDFGRGNAKTLRRDRCCFQTIFLPFQTCAGIGDSAVDRNGTDRF